MAFRIHEWLLTTWGLNIPIPAYFPLLALGFIAGVYVSVREAQRTGIGVHHLLNMYLYAALGILAGLAVLVVYVTSRGLPLLAFADTLPAGFGLVLFFARIGCFLEGSCYGVVTRLPWGVRFPLGSVAYAGLLQERFVTRGERLTPPLHPTQLYSAAAGLGLLALAVWLARRKRFQGEVFFGGLLFYAATRIVIDAFRGDLGDETLFFGLLPTTQLITALLGIAALLGLGYLSWRFKRAGRVGHCV